MVFCYKIITDTPRRSSVASPRKSPVKLANVPSSLSQLIGTIDYDNESVLDSIPEREWRLLAAVARKREEDVEREKLAEQFRRLWEQEKQERDLVEVETSHQYNLYLNRRRQQQASLYAYKRMQLTAEQELKRGQLMDSIRHKDLRSQELLAWREDKKFNEAVEKAMEDETRMLLAAERRSRQIEAEQWRKHLEMAETQKKAQDARSKRTALLKESAQRVALNNALSNWESCLLRQEVSVLEANRRAHHAAHAALTEERSANLARARERQQKRARKIATITAQMRQDIKLGRGTACH